MLAIRRVCTILLAVIWLANCGCFEEKERPGPAEILIVDAETKLGIPNVEVKFTPLTGGNVVYSTTDVTGKVQTFPAERDYFMNVTAPGYNTQDTSLIGFGTGLKDTLIFYLHPIAPTLVFHTVVVPNGQQQPIPANVIVNDSQNKTVFSGATALQDPANTFASVTVANLQPATAYTYIVSAAGYVSVPGTVTTSANNKAVEVDVQLSPQPAPTVMVEFRTNAFGGRVPTIAFITIQPGNFGRITTGPSPNQNFDFADVPGFTAGVEYTYSATDTQTQQILTGTFTPTVSMTGAPYVVNIQFGSATTSLKPLPPP